MPTLLQPPMSFPRSQDWHSTIIIDSEVNKSTPGPHQSAMGNSLSSGMNASLGCFMTFHHSTQLLPKSASFLLKQMAERCPEIYEEIRHELVMEPANLRRADKPPIFLLGVTRIITHTPWQVVQLRRCKCGVRIVPNGRRARQQSKRSDGICPDVCAAKCYCFYNFIIIILAIKLVGLRTIFTPLWLTRETSFSSVLVHIISGS